MPSDSVSGKVVKGVGPPRCPGKNRKVVLLPVVFPCLRVVCRSSANGAFYSAPSASRLLAMSRLPDLFAGILLPT